MPVRTICAILLLAAVFGSASSAAAATRVENITKTKIGQVSFDGVGCTATSTQTIRLPRGTRSVRTIFPDIGADLYTAGSNDPIAIIDSLDSGPRSVNWVAIGAGDSCLPENAGRAWSTAVVVLKVRYVVRARVLTRRTVIDRGNTICRAGLAQAGRIRSERTPSAYANVARIVRKVHRKLGAMRVSKNGRGSFDRYRTQLNRAQRALDRAAASARKRDQRATLKAEKEVAAAAVIARSAALKYGFRACADYAFSG
jgi:hypothetical protein